MSEDFDLDKKTVEVTAHKIEGEKKGADSDGTAGLQHFVLHGNNDNHDTTECSIAQQPSLQCPPICVCQSACLLC